MNDYLLKVKVVNNRIIALMKKKGFPNAPALSRAICGSNNLCAQIGELINMTMSPLNSKSIKGEQNQHTLWKPIVVQISEALNCLPEEMFNAQQLYDPLETNKAEKEIDYKMMALLMPTPHVFIEGSEYVENEEKNAILLEALDRLTPREKKIIVKRFGLNGNEPETLERIALDEGRTRALIRSIERRALHKLRSGGWDNKLTELYSNE